MASSLSRFLFILLSLAISLSCPAEDKIKILTNNWTSQIVLSHITGKMLSTIGYPVSYVQSSTSDQWGALAHGSADIQVEVWEGTMSDRFNRLVANNSILDAGTHTAKTREDWWYPLYVEKLCPGLPDWRALKACAKLFQQPDSQGLGVYYAGPWEKPDEARIRALEMDFKVELLDTGDDLWRVLKSAYNDQTPIVLFNWTPNWVESRYPGRFVEFPTHHIDCETDPRWGVNQQFLYDCGNPKGGWLKKAASLSLKQNNPCAFKTLKNIDLDNQQISALSAKVDIDQQSYQQAADEWLKENHTLWQSWIAAECRL